MKHRRGNIVGYFLEGLSQATGLFPWPIPYSETWRYKQMSIEYQSLRRAAYYSRQQRFIEAVTIKSKRFIRLTAKGQLYILLQKAGAHRQTHWDGKWRMIIFDIPEKARQQRDHFRRMLKENNFVRLQDSVFVSPYPLNREAVAYLKQTGLMEFIRLAKVEEFDEDKDLRRKFNL